jgi:ethanolamine utilization protein EutN
MMVHRVVSDLVTTSRHLWLEALPLRVLVDARGNYDVAVDPVGTKPGDFVITIGYSAARTAAGDPRIVTDLTVGGIIDHWDEASWRNAARSRDGDRNAGTPPAGPGPQSPPGT